MDVYLRALKDTKPSPGQPRVIYAGMEEVEMSAERHEEGIPYHPEVIGWYSETLADLGVEDYFADEDLKGWTGEATAAAYASVNTRRD